jgi:hypothetical protein
MAFLFPPPISVYCVPQERFGNIPFLLRRRIVHEESFSSRRRFALSSYYRLVRWSFSRLCHTVGVKQLDPKQVQRNRREC